MRRFVSIAITLALVALVATISWAAEGKKFDVSDIIQYKALSSYSEAPELAAAVSKGDLPPIGQRLPKKPAVIMSKGMRDGPGIYGDVWRTVSAVPTAGWNWGAAVVSGWFGIEESMHEALLNTGMSWRLKNGEPGPNLATSWEWSADGKTLTMHLIEGAKWSDGVEFTADDVLWTYYDMIIDPQVPSFQEAGTWTIGGKVTELEKVDKYTIRWHFGAPFPVYILWRMDYLDFSVSPKHLLSKYHPKYNPSSTYQQLINAQPPDALPPVVLGAWVPVVFEEDKALIMKRNPYYWKVDETGKQLPYIGEFYFKKARSGIVRDLDMIAGTCDQTHLETPGLFSFVMEQARRPDAHFRIEPGRFTLVFELEMNFALYQGVKSERDLEMRKLFRNLDFRKAISHAIDREGVAAALVLGPMLRQHPGSFTSGADYYDANAVTSYLYDPQKSKDLLAKLGFRDTDRDGIVNWTTGPLRGENLTIVVNINEDQTASVDMGEAMVPLFEKVGIKLVPKILKATVNTALQNAGEFDMVITRPAASRGAPFVFLTDLGAITPQSPNWHRAGPGDKRDLLPFEARIAELLEKLKSERTVEGRQKMFSEIQRLWTENLYTVGIVEGIYSTGITKRFKNVPDGVPARLHQWFHANVMQEQVWTPKEQQLPEHLPGFVVTYKKGM
jgi:peptide/nickel transport system substrate-binding protein